jgi:glycosyltransferase involved in cell wall biosynthesis
MPKNILFTSWYTALGGGETDLLSIAQALDPANWTCHLLLPQEGKLAQRWRELGLPVHILPYRGASTYFIPEFWGRFPVVKRIAELLQREKIDLIASEYHTLPLIYPAAQKLAIPVQWTVHGWWFRPKFWQRDFFRKIPIVARSYSIRDGFLGEPPFMPIENVPVIYSGVDTRRFSPDADGLRLRFQTNIPQDAPLVAMIARFQPVKGHHTFQAMARQVALQIPETHFVVAGEDTFGVAKDESYKQQILETAKTDPLLRNLHYIGFREDVERVIAAADVVVCASDFESYGKANIEAMACGKAVVSSNRGGPAETLIDGETGYLVPAGNAEELAKRVIELLRSPEERTRLGHNGRKRVETVFSAEKAGKSYEGEFQRILENTQ